MKKLFFLSMLCLSMTLSAQETKDPATIEVPEAESNLKLAAELSKYGYANKSALSLIQAAQIVIDNKFQEEDAKKDNETEALSDTDKQGKVTLDTRQLLEDAKVFAEDDETLLSLIEQVSKARKKRGPVGGAKYSRTSVNANSSDRYSLNFIAGSTAIVTVVGDGDTDLDLYVYDSNGNLICKDEDYTDNCVVAFTPLWTGKFNIVVVNRGYVYNNYIIRMS